MYTRSVQQAKFEEISYRISNLPPPGYPSAFRKTVIPYVIHSTSSDWLTRRVVGGNHQSEDRCQPGSRPDSDLSISMMAASIPLCTTRILPVHICFVMSAALSTKKQKTQNQTILTAHNLLYPPPLPNRPAHTHTKVGKKQPTKPTSNPPPPTI